MRLKKRIRVEIYLYALQATCNDQCPQIRRHGVKALKVASELLKLRARSPVFSEIFDVGYLLLDIPFRSTLIDLGQDNAGAGFLALSDYFNGARVHVLAIIPDSQWVKMAYSNEDSREASIT